MKVLLPRTLLAAVLLVAAAACGTDEEMHAGPPLAATRTAVTPQPAWPAPAAPDAVRWEDGDNHPPTF